MAGKTLDIREIIVEDQLGVTIARQWMLWHTLRQPKIRDWEELRRYVYATDTSLTTNSKLPWKNKTTIPKLCQIRDNLSANYLLSMFPKKKSITWLADDDDSDDLEKRSAIINYMAWAISQPSFKDEVSKLVLDYIDYGNCFAMPVWEDQRVELEDEARNQVGYVGPAIRRINPLDIVFNPIADSFEKSPKIVKSLISMGEVKDLLTRMSTDENREEYEALFEYLKAVRHSLRTSGGELRTYDDYYNVDGFTNFQMYLQSDYVELLTFYGDMYDRDTDTYYKNHQIMVVDRHKVIGLKPNPSYFGYPPIFHVGWRKRQDNLWAMGPLDNLVGMQYRLDHIENLKADVFDLLTFPPLKVKGYVDDFKWGPMERIYIHDDGDVEMVAPPWNVLQANVEIAQLQQTMEEMAGSPKEAMGFRSPGEKTAFEVQRLENAASRIFQNKISQFEEMFLEKLLNGMLECARRNMPSATSISVFDDDFKIQTFMKLSPNDITGMGRIKPMAARHFAEQSEMVQNLSQFFQSTIGQDQEIKAHFSSIKLARLFEDILNLTDYNLVTPFIRLAEQGDAQRLANALSEQVMMEAQTPAGLKPDDYDHELSAPPGAQTPGPPGGQQPSMAGPPPMAQPAQGGAPGGGGPQVPPIGPNGPGDMLGNEG